MVRHTLKILQQMLQDFQSVSDRFKTLCIKGLRTSSLALNYNSKLFKKDFFLSFFVPFSKFFNSVAKLL